MTPAELDDLLVEPMARAICVAQEHDITGNGGSLDPFSGEPLWKHWIPCARAALAAQRATLATNSLFIGPEVATPGMVDVAERSGHSRESAVFMWNLMRAEWQRGDAT